MNELAIRLHEAATVLENDGDFYRSYTGDVNKRSGAFERRGRIALALGRNDLPSDVQKGASVLEGRAAREHLRRYLDDVWDLPPPAPTASADPIAEEWTELKFWEDSVKYPPTPAQAETPVPAPQAETPPAGNGKPAQLPDDVELQTIDGVGWHVTRMPDGCISYSMATARRVWDEFGKASDMQYRRQARDWTPLTNPNFTGNNPYRWKPEFTYKLLEQEASEARVQETPKRLSQDHATDSLAYLDNLLETQAKETIMSNTTKPATGEPVQTTPSFAQLNQILDNLDRCHSRDSKVEFLRSWIRDWTQHKVDKLTHPVPIVPATDSLAYLTNLLNTQAKETIMSNTTKPAAIVITTKTLVNGVDISTVADSHIYDLIATQEAAVADLEKIDNKPKKLVSEIAKRKAGIQALVDYLDSKEPADKADDAGSNSAAASA